MLNCQKCNNPCFDFEKTGICPREADWAPVPCCPDENEIYFDKSIVAKNIPP